MSDDLVALNVLVVSDSDAELNALRDAAARASVIVDVSEVKHIVDAAPTCSLLGSKSIDVVFLDNRMPFEGQRAVIEAARVVEARPLVISVGVPQPPASGAATGLAVDGSLVKPVQHDDARGLLDACVRARLSSRILVVDDSATVRSVIRKVLQSCRYRFDISEAADGMDALDQAGQQRFDVVLLDSSMPGLDGFATLAKFLDDHPSTKLVMVTATNDSKTAARARAAGAHEVLYKPFYAKDVDAMVGRLYGLMRPDAS